MAGETTLGTGAVRLTADATALDRGLDRARQKAGTATSQIQRGLDGVDRKVSATAGQFSTLDNVLNKVGRGFVAFASAASAGALAGAVRNIVSTNAALGDLADRLDVSSESLQAWRHAAEESGAQGQDLDRALEQLTRRIGEFAKLGTGEGAEAFRQLGIAGEITSGQLQGTDAVFRAIIERMGGIESATARAALGAKLFGEEGGTRLSAMLGRGTAGMAELEQQARDLGIVVEDDLIQAARRLDREWSRAMDGMQGRLASFVLSVTDAVATVVRDAAAIPKRFAEATTEAANLKRQAEQVAALLARLDTAMDRPGLTDEALKKLRDRAEPLRAELAALRAQIEALGRAGETAGPKVGGTIPPPEVISAKAQKVVDALKAEQAQIGLTDEAREIAVALVRAEVDAKSAAGRQIADLVRAINAEKQALDRRNRALSESAKLEEGMFLSAADADEIQANIQKQTLAPSDLNRALERELEIAKVKASLAGQSQQDQEVGLRLLQYEIEAREAGLAVGEEEIRQARALIAARVALDAQTEKARKAAEQAARDAERMIDSVTQYIADNLVDTAFADTEQSWRETWNHMERWALRSLARVAAEAIIRPQIQAAFGVTGAGGAAAGGGLGIPGMAGANALSFAGGFGSAGGMLGGISAGASLYNVLVNGASWTMGSDALVSMAGQLGGYLGGTAGASSFAQAADAFSSPIGSIGSFAANMILNQLLGDRGMGASAGSMIGGIAGSFLGLGPWGTVAGSALGNIIGGMFGGKKPSVGPNAYAESRFGSQGWSLWETGADNGGQAEPLADLSRQIGEGFAALVQQLGGSIAAGQQTNFHLGNFPSQGGVWAAVGGTDGRQSFGEDSEAAVRFILAGLLDTLEIEGLGAEFEAAASKAIRLADSTEQMTADLEFLRAYFDDGVLSEDAKSEAERFMDALAESFDEARATVTRLGLDMARLEEMRGDAIADFVSGFNEASADAIGRIEDPLAQALIEFDRWAEALRAEAAYLEEWGADVALIERRIALERQKVIEQFGNDATDRLRDALLRLETGSNSALSPGMQLEIARQAFEQTAGLALGGDAEAQSNIASVIDTFLAASRSFNAETAAFAADFEAARKLLRALTGDNSATPAAALAALPSMADASVPGFEALERQLASANELASTNRAIGMDTLVIMTEMQRDGRRTAIATERTALLLESVDRRLQTLENRAAA